MVQSVRCVKCAAVRRAQPPALAQRTTASATHARRFGKTFNGARHRASMLAAAAQTLFLYKRGVARPSVRSVAKQHGVPRSTLSDFINRGGRVATRGRPTALTEAEEMHLVSIVKGAQARWWRSCGGFGKKMAGIRHFTVYTRYDTVYTVYGKIQPNRLW
ncbi:hypothetical protein HaLaN_03415, partial [Haematococcus lacustris]